ncbi:WhiB family transcriptional regulator [Nesterenkonia sp. NBAIMH1]|uniref:WhiB family transcriptional regulator n=1 Tax=Nesterenkonia sp. NBAIMH1 TaxID=2600320 RepID=UPI0011B4FA33|nr:WhiB family transcriptional regulator [Nesterenkonia sp. NBAIMH1]
MGKAQHAAELKTGETEGESAARHRGLDIPHDWFIDPADPSAADRMEHGASIEDQATAYLRAAEALEKAVEEEVETKVTSLDEAPSRRSFVPTSAPRELPGDAESQRLTVGMPSLLPTEQVEGELAWQVDALCAQTDPEAFFPEKGGSTRDAKKICGACTVKQECLDYALANDERFGIWGGLSERERRKLKKRRA